MSGPHWQIGRLSRGPGPDLKICGLVTKATPFLFFYSVRCHVEKLNCLLFLQLFGSRIISKWKKIFCIKLFAIELFYRLFYRILILKYLQWISSKGNADTQGLSQEEEQSENRPGWGQWTASWHRLGFSRSQLLKMWHLGARRPACSCQSCHQMFVAVYRLCKECILYLIYLSQ